MVGLFANKNEEVANSKRKLQAVAAIHENSFIAMAGPVLFYIFFYPIIIAIVIIFLKFGPRVKRCRVMKVRIACKNFAFFDYPIRVLLLGSTPLITAVMVHSANEVETSGFTAFIIALLMSALIVSIPLIFIFLYKNKGKLGDFAFRLKFGALYSDIYSKSKLAYLYTPLFLLRRLIIAIPIVALPWNQVQQVQF